MDPQTTAGKVERSSRFGAAYSAAGLDWRIHTLQKRARKLLTEAGASIVSSLTLIELPQADANALRAKISDVLLQMNALDVGLRDSLDKDRQDYTKASQLMRWIVVTRGMLDRWILRDRIRFHQRERDRLAYDMGMLVFDGSHDALLGTLPPLLRDGIVQARAAIASARAQREKLLAPWNGEPLPKGLTRVLAEIRTLIRHVWEQLTKKLFLRAPAIAALIASWWLAHHYSGSFTERLRHSMGLGGRTPLDPETLKLVVFWVPLFAAALCTYLANVVATHVQRKYALPKDR